ncbi:MAG: GH3 auxin-responsive promoter family protein [Phormidesmis sp.]
MREVIMRSVIKAFGQLLAPTSKRFYKALENPQQAQQAVQQRLVKRLKNCEYGQKYQIDTIEDWHRLPIVTYEDLHPWIPPVGQLVTQRSSLTPEPILFYEPTSGSSGPRKQIPYTRSLRRSFNYLFGIWAHDLIVNGSGFTTGKFYFSISPTFTQVDTPQGTTDEADYLDPWLRWLLRPFMVTAPQTHTPEEFKGQLAQTLLKAADLEIISIWSPSFLTAQLDYIQRHQLQLATALKSTLSSDRLALLQQDKISWASLWPNLKLISCWDSVTAADGASTLSSHFPTALVQGKGLLATEAPMTVPLIAANGHVPMLSEIYFEFADATGRCHALHELEIGKTYEVIISQMGGLYRYRMGDRIKVTHYFRSTPCLEFVGCGKAVSDLVGEKLHIQFVSDVLAKLDLSPSSFQSLVPVRQPQDHYVLLLDKFEGDVDAIAQQLDQALCESFHYQLARQLEQLCPAKLLVSATVVEQLAANRLTDGQRWGDMKHTKLSTKSYQDLSFISSESQFVSELSP